MKKLKISPADYLRYFIKHISLYDFVALCLIYVVITFISNNSNFVWYKALIEAVFIIACYNVIGVFRLFVKKSKLQELLFQIEVKKQDSYNLQNLTQLLTHIRDHLYKEKETLFIFKIEIDLQSITDNEETDTNEVVDTIIKILTPVGFEKMLVYTCFENHLHLTFKKTSEKHETEIETQLEFFFKTFDLKANYKNETKLV